MIYTKRVVVYIYHTQDLPEFCDFIDYINVSSSYVEGEIFLPTSNSLTFIFKLIIATSTSFGDLIPVHTTLHVEKIRNTHFGSGIR